MSKKDWKPGLGEQSATSLWYGDVTGASPVIYTVRLAGRDIEITRGEIVATCLAGLLAGLFTAGVQTGLIHRPRPYQPALVHYDAPKPRLLGSTERTRPVDPMSNRHFDNDAAHSAPVHQEPVVSTESYEGLDAGPVDSAEPADAG
jgi:hypothetical protein